MTTAHETRKRIKYRPKFTLCRLAAIAISKQVWQYSNLKQSLKLHIREDSDPEDTLPTAITSMVDCFALPEPIKQDLTFVVGTMGMQIWHFFEELEWAYCGVSVEDLVTPLIEPSDYVDHICWTDYGSINASETIRSLYLSSMLPKNRATWVELCTYCLEDCLSDLWAALSNIGDDQYSNWRHRVIRSYFEYDVIISAYWTARMTNDEKLVGNMLRTLPDVFYEEGWSIDQTMFVNSFVQKKLPAVRFFWGILNDGQKFEAIASIGGKIRSDDHQSKQIRDLFFQRDGVDSELLTFFLRQLYVYEFHDVRSEILGSGFVLGQMLSWPHENVFWGMLKESWSYHDSIDYNPIVSSILDNICYQQQFLQRDVKYHNIFREIWQVNPGNLKTSIDYHDALNMLWGLNDIEILKCVLNDEDLCGRREEFLNRIAEIHVKGSTDLDLLEEFLTTVLVSEKERGLFRGRIDQISSVNY